MAPVTEKLSASDRGKAIRAEVPRSSHADFQPASGSRDPVALLEERDYAALGEAVDSGRIEAEIGL